MERYVANIQPDAIYFSGFAPEAARLVQAQAEAGLEDILFIGSDAVTTDEFIELAGPLAEGVYGVRTVYTRTPAVNRFNARYESTYDEPPPAPFSTNAYDATQMMLNAVEAVAVLDGDGNLVVDRAALAEALRGLTYKGLNGTFVCTGNGDCLGVDIRLWQVIDGEWVEVA
jgi:branched-chain amino acid transport system substrate-binding protein